MEHVCHVDWLLRPVVTDSWCVAGNSNEGQMIGLDCQPKDSMSSHANPDLVEQQGFDRPKECVMYSTRFGNGLGSMNAAANPGVNANANANGTEESTCTHTHDGMR